MDDAGYVSVYSGAAGEVMAYLLPKDSSIWRARAREAAKIGRRTAARAPHDGADT